MKPVIVQTMIRRQRCKKVTADPVVANWQKASDGMFVIILAVLVVIVVSAIGIGA